MAVMSPEVLADPLHVITDLVWGVDQTLDRATVAEVVRAVGGGRATQRRLAQALVDNPSLLDDGRSPAPKVAGTLLIALRAAGAGRISPPVCANCGKPLRTLHRRGQDWFCHVCGPQPEPCAICGQLRRVATRDRDGRPRCLRCPPDHGRDPTQTVIDVVATVDPAIPAETVADAVAAVTSKAGQRWQLAWALHDRPELLTGAGARAPVPSALRLIERLCEAGATGIVRPACPRCGRVIALTKTLDGVRLCRNCVAKARAQPCAGCGAVSEPATRDQHGQPLCAHCLTTDPANQETCISCGRTRPVSVRSPGGPLCPNCRPVQTMTCSICDRTAPCEISKATGRPWCGACSQRWARCASCGKVRPVKSGSLTEPRCATCTRPDPAFWKTCPTCGDPRLRSDACNRCGLNQRLAELLSDATGDIRPELQALYDNLATTDRPATVLRWLSHSTVPDVLGELGAGRRPLTHDALDELPASKPLEHLRSVLVATGALPARDEHMARLERWITATIAARHDPDEQQLLHRYAVWHLLRRLRNRLNGADTTHTQAVTVRQHVRGAIVLLDWASANGLTLATCGQGDLDAWLTSGYATHRREVGHFVRWAKAHKLTNLEFAAVRWGGPSRVIDTEARWDQARRLIHDDTLKPEDRVAGLLVLLYAQWPAAISRLTLDHVETSDNQVRLRLSREPLVVPEPLAGLVLDLVATRSGHATIGDPRTSQWLFPGGQPGRPISAERLAERLRQLDLNPAQGRSTALFQLATELPAAVLARMLGIHISVAVAWQRASNGDWTNYAADISRRTGD